MNAPRPDAAHVAQQIRRDKLRDPAMFSSPSSSVAEFAAAEQIPLIAPSSSSSSSVILHPPPGCDWPAPPPPLAPYGHLYHQTPPADLHFAPAPLAWAVDAPGGGAGAGAGEMVFLPPEWSGGADAGAGAGDPRSARGLSLTLAFTSAAELCAVPYPTLLSDGGGSLQDVVGSTGEAAARRGAGPLGPFTGYAAILRSSRFLRPAQQLLDEFCGAVTGGKASKRGLVGEAIRGAASGCGYDVAGGEKESVSRGGNSGASTSSVYNSADLAGDQTGGGGGSKIHRPEFQQKKAKLLHMQEEVCRRYKQYHQQMQMVVSSFESVAGLNSATPYTSLALKSISKHFRNLKNAISDQIRHISKVLGEELLSSPSSSRGDATTSRLKYLDHSLRKQKACESTLSFMDNTQPVWRPQRGLPERAVSVLRAWLFEHFLHPYPTDSDKHMLATQTGLSRNQVSNWFINARVRLWKPMIEEIHMLETKGMSGINLNSANVRDSRLVAGGDDAARVANEPRMQLQQNAPIGYASMEPEFNDESSQNAESWQVDKRSRVEECEMLTNMDGGLMNFATYQHAMDIGGIEAVSLTLGLRHEGGQQNPQQMRHFGTQMFHDFVG